MLSDIKFAQDKGAAFRPDLIAAEPAQPLSVQGLARFFTPENVRRYQTLASEPLDPDQRRKILQALGRELEAFRAEMQSSR